MSKKIRKLEENLINLIAAGEVVERPSSVVKELLENSIDSGATKITVKIKNFGKEEITIIDNGIGIPFDDLSKTILQHATSKIYTKDDLFNISTLGFRGEALASISEVSGKFIIESKNIESTGGTLLKTGNQTNIEKKDILNTGTKVSVENIFDNIPARKKFLKSDNTELGKIYDVFLSTALPYVNIHFELFHNDKLIYKLTKTSTFTNRIFDIWGKDVAENIYASNKVTINDISYNVFIGSPLITKKTAFLQYTYINNRFITDKIIHSAISNGYKGFIHKELKPVYIAFLDVDPKKVDVNVHPRKLEAKFENSAEIYKNMYQITQKILSSQTKLLINNNIPSTLINVSNNISKEYDLQRNQEYFLVKDTNSLSRKTNSVNYPSSQRDKEIRSGSISQALEFSKEILDFELENHTPSNRNINPFQIFNTYIIYEIDDKIVFIDQHAAAEKINFEKLALSIENIRSKPLLIPKIITLSDYQKTDILKIKNELSTLGLTIEDFQGNEISVTEIPELLKREQDIDELINSLTSKDNDIENLFLVYKEIYSSLTELNYHLLATIACHSSIRAGQVLNREEMLNITKDLNSLKNPYNCPHGRPVSWELSKKEVDKFFKRII